MKTILSTEDFNVSGYNAQEVSRLNKYFNHYKDKSQKWRTRGKEYESVVFNDVEGTGTQFTASQLNTLQDTNTIPISLSLSIAFIEQIQSFLTSGKPSITVVPVGNTSKQAAYVARDIITAILYLNNFSSKLEQSIQDQEIVGNGYIHVTLPNFFQANSFNVVVKDQDWRTVYLDPMSSERDIEDSEMVFICTPMLKSKAKKVYNLTDNELKFVESSYDGFDAVYDSTEYPYYVPEGNYKDDALVWAMEIYEKVFATLYVLVDGTKTFDKPQASVDKDGQLVNQVQYEVPATFVKRTVKLGNLIKDSRIFPINKYPLILYKHTHNRTPYGYGIMHHIIDLVHALEKCLILTFQNAQVASNAGWTAPTGTIQDKEKFKKSKSTPGAVAEYDADMNLPNGGAPIQTMPLPLPNAWFTLVQQIIKLIEYVTGIYELVQGNPEHAPQTLGATQSIQSFGTQRPKMYARRIDIANQKLGEVIMQFYQAFAPLENVLRYIDETGTLKEIETNVASTMNQQGQPQPYALGQQTASYVKDEAGKIVKSYLGDIRQCEFQVRFQSSNDLPTARAAVQQMLQSLMGRMGNDAMAIAIAQMSMKLMDFPEVDEIMRNVDIMGQLQDQVKNLGDQLTQEQKDNIKLRNQLEEDDRKLAVMNLQSNFDKLKAEAQRHVDKLKDNVEEEIASEKRAQNQEPEIR